MKQERTSLADKELQPTSPSSGPADEFSDQLSSSPTYPFVSIKKAGSEEGSEAVLVKW